MPYDHDTFISPFTWRYGSSRMRQTWSEENKRRLMRRAWVALASAQHEAGLVTAAQLADLRRQVNNVDIGRTLQIERETRHDVMAELRAFAEQCPVGGGIIHWGATSADITDNVDVLRIREAAQLIEHRLKSILACFVERIESTADVPVMAYTHLQPAEPTTLGYRFAVYAQDLSEDLTDLQNLISNLRGKGFKGAVGTQATYLELLKETGVSPEQMETSAMALLELPAFPIATQTYTRRQDLRVLSVMATIAASLHKFALDFRILQSPHSGEWAEPFAKNQVGSTAMPFKRNPIITENICSLARYVASLPAVAWDNASQAMLERSLDDSANRRIILAQAFLAVDEMFLKATSVLTEMEIDEAAIGKNLAEYGPFAATEGVLMALVASGADRQEAHEWIRQASMQAREVLRDGGDNPLTEMLAEDGQIRQYLAADEVRDLMTAGKHLGTAAERSRRFAQRLKLKVKVEADG